MKIFSLRMSHILTALVLPVPETARDVAGTTIILYNGVGRFDMGKRGHSYVPFDAALQIEMETQ
ncbi:MAG: hypothetical protein IIB38_02515 [Candidatus Hydrogenedentes bacterium]|nr:hypothetical protein [Candidatus Hydrogenedentota bacterium]